MRQVRFLLDLPAARIYSVYWERQPKADCVYLKIFSHTHFHHI